MNPDQIAALSALTNAVASLISLDTVISQTDQRQPCYPELRTAYETFRKEWPEVN